MNEIFKALNDIYKPLHEYSTALLNALRNAGYEAVRGYYNNHYIKKADEWAVEYYPVPVISVKNVCDICLDINRTFVEFKLERQAALAFDWAALIGLSFEVYGAQDYLLDFYDPACGFEEIGKKISQSGEREIAVSLRLGYLPGEDILLDLVKMLKETLPSRA